MAARVPGAAGGHGLDVGLADRKLDRAIGAGGDDPLSDSVADRPLPPSDRKRLRAWDEGSYPVTPDLAGLVLLAFALGAGGLLIDALWTNATAVCRLCWDQAVTRPHEALETLALARPVGHLLLVSGGAAGAIGALACISVAVQRGLRLRLSNVGGAPFAGQPRGLWEGTMAFLRLMAATGAACAALRWAGAGHLAHVTATAHTTVALLVGLAATDYLVRRFSFERSLGMTHAEAREEARAAEGSPDTRAEVRRTLRARRADDIARPDHVLILSGSCAALVAFSPDPAVEPRLLSWSEGAMARRCEEAARFQDLKIVVRPDLAAMLAPDRARVVLSGALVDALAQVHVDLYGASGRPARPAPLPRR